MPAVAAVGVGLYQAKQASKAGNAARRSVERQDRIAAEQWQNYLDIYDPIAQQLAYEIGGIQPTSEEAIAGLNVQQYGENAAATRAGADVATSFDVARQNAERNAARYGINPNSGAWAGIDRGVQIAQGAGQASAMNNARQIKHQQNIDNKTRMVGLGRGLPESSARIFGDVGDWYSNRSSQLWQSANSNFSLAADALVGGLGGGGGSMFGGGGFSGIGI